MDYLRFSSTTRHHITHAWQMLILLLLIVSLRLRRPITIVRCKFLRKFLKLSRLVSKLCLEFSRIFNASHGRNLILNSNQKLSIRTLQTNTKKSNGIFSGKTNIHLLNPAWYFINFIDDKKLNKIQSKCGLNHQKNLDTINCFISKIRQFSFFGLLKLNYIKIHLPKLRLCESGLFSFSLIFWRKKNFCI